LILFDKNVVYLRRNSMHDELEACVTVDNQ